jgi:hypothetical protein
MLLKRVLRSFSASPGGRAATPSNITLSAQALYWASILTECVSIIWEISRCRHERSFLEISSPGPLKGSVGDPAQMSLCLTFLRSSKFFARRPGNAQTFFRQNSNMLTWDSAPWH